MQFQVERMEMSAICASNCGMTAGEEKERQQRGFSRKLFGSNGALGNNGSQNPPRMPLL